MDDKTIIVKAQEADILVKKYARDIDSFRENAKQDFKSIKNNVYSMGLHWKGDIYDAFKKNMDTHLNQMQKCISGLDDLTKKLEVISQKFSDAIATIKKSLGE